MTQYVIVRINDKLIPEFQISYDSKSREAKYYYINAWKEIEVKSNQTLYLILSANLVLNSQVKIPSKNEEVIKQSIPFAVEEELADDLNQNHIAYTHFKEYDFLVSTVKRSILSDLLASLEEHNITAKGLFSEIFTCPYEENGMTVCHHKMSSIARLGNTGTTVSSKSLNTYLKLSKAKSIKLYSESLTPSQNEKIVINKVDNLALLQAESLLQNKSVNIFQGEFDHDLKNTKNSSPWKKVFILISILVASWMLINLSQLWDLNSKINSIRNQQTQVLNKLIPSANDTEKRDPYAAIISKFKSTQGNSNLSSNTFILGLNYLGLTLQQHQNIKVESIRLREAEFEISIQASDVIGLNQFQSSLQKNAYSMRVKTGTRDASKDGVNAILTMEEL